MINIVQILVSFEAWFMYIFNIFLWSGTFCTPCICISINLYIVERLRLTIKSSIKTQGSKLNTHTQVRGVSITELSQNAGTVLDNQVRANLFKLKILQ